MKAVLSIFCLLFLSNIFASEEKGLFYTYRVDSSKIDQHLKSTESIFSFTFYNVSTDIPIEGIRFAYNGVNQIGKLDANNSFDVKLSPGSYVFEFYYSSQYFEIRTDSLKINGQERVFVSVFFRNSETEIMVDKPVIYLYPEKESEINVQLKPKGDLTFTYPEYENEWNFKAKPSGELSFGENSFNYLFWESSQKIDPETLDLTKGFVVEKENTLAFLEDKLEAFGLNSKEKADFITFWGPQLMQNSSNFVHFVLNDDCDQFAELSINPKPDHLYRIYILTSPITQSVSLLPEAQKLEKIDRSGFTVIEWGGSQIPQVELTQIFN